MRQICKQENHLTIISFLFYVLLSVLSKRKVISKYRRLQCCVGKRKMPCLPLSDTVEHVFAHLIPWNDLHSLEIMCYIKQKCVMGTPFSSRDSTGIKLPNMRAACLGNHQHYQTYKSTWLWKALRSRFMTHSLRP